MANHVYNYITVEGNEAVQLEWDKLFTNYHEEIERPSYHGDGTIKVVDINSGKFLFIILNRSSTKLFQSPRCILDRIHYDETS